MKLSFKNLGNVLFYLFGSAQYFVGFQVGNIQSYGVQINVVVALIIILYAIIDAKKIKVSALSSIFAIFLIVFLLNFFTTESENQIFFHTLLVLCLQIGIYISFNRIEQLNCFFFGYIHLALVSSILSILQSIPGINIYVPYLLNNTNFSLVSNGILRGFAVTPEPSVLASLLLPILPIYFFRRVYPQKDNENSPFDLSIMGFVLVFLGILATRSQSIIFLLPILLLTVIFSHKKIWKNLFFQNKFGLLTVPFRITLVLMIFCTLIYGVVPILLARIDSGDAIGSFQIRYYSIILPLEKSFENPIFGNGFGSSRILIESNQQLFESAGGGIKAGVDSIFARIIFEQGYLYFTLLAIFSLYLLRKLVGKFEYFLFFLTTLLCSAFVYGYRDFLIFPIIFSLMLKYISLNKHELELSERK